MMVTVRAGTIAVAVLILSVVAGCSREQQDWRSAEGTDSIEAYGRFIEHHPDSELATQARTRIAQLGEDRDWQIAGSGDTADAYRQFLAQHPNGKWAQEARIRIENFSLGAMGAATPHIPPLAAEAAQAPATGAQPPPTQAPPVRTAQPVEASAPSRTPASASVPAPVPRTGVSSAIASTGYGIQLGAFSSEDKAGSEWRDLTSRFSTQLGGLAPHTVSVAASAGRLFRLQAAVATEAQARAICGELKKQGQACVPVIPH
jgi:cell division septation protein DedD